MSLFQLSHAEQNVMALAQEAIAAGVSLTSILELFLKYKDSIPQIIDAIRVLIDLVKKIPTTPTPPTNPGVIEVKPGQTVGYDAKMSDPVKPVSYGFGTGFGCGCGGR